MKKLSALFVVFVLLFGFSSSNAQPQFIIHLTGGYNQPLPDLQGDLTDSADRMNTYGMKLGYGFGADGKYYLGKKRNVGITLGLGYQMFSNSEDTVEGLGKDIKYKLNALAVGLGIEYAFMPKGKANPFIGAEFTGHFFSGNAEGVFFGAQNTSDLEAASRFGLGVGAGVDIALSKSVGIVIGGKYQLANLIGKDYDSTFTSGKYFLNDDEFTVTTGTTTTTFEARNISYLQFYAGVSFYLNQPKKVKK